MNKTWCLQEKKRKVHINFFEHIIFFFIQPTKFTGYPGGCYKKKSVIIKSLLRSELQNCAPRTSTKSKCPNNHGLFHFFPYAILLLTNFPRCLNSNIHIVDSSTQNNKINMFCLTVGLYVFVP